MTSITIRPATRDDIEAFSSVPDKPTMKAWLGEVDGRIIGMGGLYFHKGRWCGFCDLTDEARRYKLAIAKTARLVMAEAKRMGIRFVYSDVDPEEPNALRWHKKLGFELDQRSQCLMKWTNR